MSGVNRHLKAQHRMLQSSCALRALVKTRLRGVTIAFAVQSFKRLSPFCFTTFITNHLTTNNIVTHVSLACITLDVVLFEGFCFQSWRKPLLFYISYLIELLLRLLYIDIGKYGLAQQFGCCCKPSSRKPHN